MKQHIKSIRPFIGAKNFEASRQFYKDLGFEETSLQHNLSLFTTANISFYLQKAYVKDWVDNTMIFIEVQDAKQFWNELLLLNLSEKYKDIKLEPVRTLEWGRECFLHDPSGILWHFGEFF